MRSTFIKLAALCVMAALLGGCGYQLGAVRPTILKGVKTIAVQTFANNSYEPRIEVLAADTVIQLLQQDGTFTVVSDTRADVILYGTITEIRRRSVQSVLNNVLATSEFELEITINWELFDRVTGRVLKRQKVVGRTSFYTSPDLQQDERQAIPLALHDAGVKMVASITEGF